MKMQRIEKALGEIEQEGIKLEDWDLYGGTDKTGDFVGEIKLTLRIEGGK